jgi:hypothetical protein
MKFTRQELHVISHALLIASDVIHTNLMNGICGANLLIQLNQQLKEFDYINDRIRNEEGIRS